MLYIIRHGITDWNLARRLQGRTDIPLNDAGREMAAKAGEKYRGVHFDVCYCSPLSRARETAEILLSGREVPIITDDRLTEMGFGEFEGVGNAYNDPDCPINVLFRAPEEYVDPPGGAESLESLMERTGDFLDKVAKPILDEGKDLLIVGHGAMNSSIICQVRGKPISVFWSGRIENCELIRLI